MEGLEDYRLHEHPLIYNDDQQEDWCCSACGLPLLLSPSYRCNNDCNFFLHEACRQLPQDLNYPVGIENLTLSLVVKPPNEKWTCHVCRDLCGNLIAYHGTQGHGFGSREVTDRIVHVDALCAFPLEIRSRHDSHEHELVAIRRKTEIDCDGCGKKHEGFFFSCKEDSCDFWIHKCCAVLPRVIETTFHDHILKFSYSHLDTFFQRFPTYNRECLFCKGKFSGSAAYYCRHCRIVAHSYCAISNIKNSGYGPPVQFPLEEADKSLFIYKMLGKKKIVEQNNDEDEKSSMEKYHNHPLIFHDIVDKDSSSNSLCNACILPVNSTRYYTCEKPECDFLVHQHCTNLPYEIELGVQDRRFTLKPKADELLPFIFDCENGGHWCNGFGFGYDCDGIAVASDLECSAAPRTIKHRLHRSQHILYLVSVTLIECLPFACCSGADYTSANRVYAYECVSCDFIIHSRCAFLPAKVSHKFDKHPLQLSSGTNVIGECSFCEICEGHLDTKYWFYHCKECDQLFHVNCVPSVGLLSKIKFGGSFVTPHHRQDHPVTLTRMLEIGNQRCCKCKDIIPGFVDDMAFQCLECCYWFHFNCALPEMV